MEKSLTTRQFAAVKRVAQNVNPLIVKKNKLLQKIEEFKDTIIKLSEEINDHEAGIKRLTEGLSSEALLIKTTKTVEKVDAEGNTIISTVPQWELSPLVRYDEESNTYIIHIPSEEDLVSNVEEPTTENIE